MNATGLERLCLGENLYIYFKFYVGFLNLSSFGFNFLKSPCFVLAIVLYMCVCVFLGRRLGGGGGGQWWAANWREEEKIKNGEEDK